MEIERKWIVDGWPEGLPLLAVQEMRQGYVSTSPTVRIREERTTFSADGGPDTGRSAAHGPAAETAYIFCIKTRAKDSAGMAREEIEFPVDGEVFRKIESILPHAPVYKERRTYRLEDGLALEVNLVDPGAPTGYMYAEVEFPSLEAGREWQPAGGLAAYLAREVTGDGRYTMAGYWRRITGEHGVGQEQRG